MTIQAEWTASFQTVSKGSSMQSAFESADSPITHDARENADFCDLLLVLGERQTGRQAMLPESSCPNRDPESSDLLNGFTSCNIQNGALGSTIFKTKIQNSRFLSVQTA